MGAILGGLGGFIAAFLLGGSHVDGFIVGALIGLIIDPFHKYQDDDQWRPISTAPKDEAVIMVCGGTYGCAVNPWPVEDRPLPGVAFVYWCGDSFCTGNDEDYDHYNPEWWMPVPKAKGE